MFTRVAATVAFVFTDDELMRRIAARDERAFGLLYERHIGAARATARRACRELSDDALQDAFFALWRDAGTFHARPGGAVGWLHTIVRNRGIDLQRQAAVRERRFVHAELDWVETRSPEDVVLAGEERERLRAAVTRLPAAQREVILLAYAGELSQPEIAARQSVALGTVKGRSRLALRRLAGAMSC
jgi:RNA polymerase sigma-70 factor (ECF subfamily)